MSGSRIKNTLKNTKMGIITRISRMIVNFVIKTLFIKCLGSQYTGVSSLFTDILIFLSFAELGIGSAITFSLYKPVAENDGERISALIHFYKTAYRIVAAIVFGVGVAILPLLKYMITDVPDIKENLMLIYFLYVVNTASSYLLIYKSVIFEAKQKRFVISMIDTGIMFVRLIIESIELIIYKKFLLYLITDISLNIIQNMIIAHKANKEYDYKNKTARISKEERNKILSDIYALAMYQVSFVALSSTDSIVISTFIGTEFVGFLSCYKMLFNQIISFLQQFIYGANASVGNLVTEGNVKKEYQLFIDLNFVFFMLSLFCCVCLFILTEPFINIWVGEGYQLGRAVVVVLTIDFFLNVMRQIVNMFRVANGLFIQGRYRPVIMAALNIGLSIALVFKWGVFGVLAATVLSKLFTEVWYDPYLVYREVFRRSVIEYYIRYLEYFVTVIVGYIAAYSLCCLVNIENIYLDFVIRLLICIIVVFICIWIFWSRASEFISCKLRIKNILKNRWIG